jgi:quercetin dioxygenase-like cupin family protein
LPKASKPSFRIGTPSAWVDVLPGLMVRSLVEEHGAALRMLRVGPGSRIDRRHSFAELGIVLAGGGRLVVEAESRHLATGDSFYVRPETDHLFETPPDGGDTIILSMEAPLRLEDSDPLLDGLRDSTERPGPKREAKVSRKRLY